MLKEGLQTLDNNVYHFARAVFYQNFMLMRKIDALSDRIRALEEKANQSSFTLPPFGICPPLTRLPPPKGQVTPHLGNFVKTRYLFQNPLLRSDIAGGVCFSQNLGRCQCAASQRRIYHAPKT